MNRELRTEAPVRAWIRQTVIIALSATMMSTCSESTGPGGPRIGQIEVGGPATVYIGYTGQFSATVLGSSGDTLRGVSLTWHSGDKSVARVDATGLVTGVALGQTDISVTAQSHTGTVPVGVKVIPVAEVLVGGGMDTVFVGATRHLTALLQDSASRPLSRPVTWSSSDTTKATVTDSGLVSVRGPGGFVISATSEAITGSTVLIGVQDVAGVHLPDTVKVGLHHTVVLLADLRSASGTHLSGRPVVWAALDTGIITYGPISGAPAAYERVYPQVLGAARFVARSGTVADTTSIVVTTEPYVYLTFGAESSAVVAGSRFHVSVLAHDSAGYETSAPAVGWVSRDTTVARVTPDSVDGHKALVTAIDRGTAVIVAQLGKLTASGSIPVQRRLARIRFPEDSLQVRVGLTLPVFLDERDSAGEFLRQEDPTLYTLRSSDTTIATTSGGVRGVGLGRTTVIATDSSRHLADTLGVVVVPDSAPVQVVWLFEQTLLTNYGNASNTLYISVDTTRLAPSSVHVSISSSDTAIAVVAPATYTGPGVVSVQIQTRRAGSAKLVASADSAFAVTVVDAGPQRLTTVQIVNKPPVLTVGDTITVEAWRYPGAYPVTWRLSDSTKASITPAGLLTALTPGTVVLTLRGDTLRDSAIITIRSPIVDAPHLDSLAPTEIVAGGSVRFYGSGFDATASANSVTVDGVPVSVTASTANSLDLTLPGTAAFTCSPTHRAQVVISSGGRVDVDSAWFRVGGFLPLNIGDASSLTATQSRCFEINGGGAEYVIGTVNAGAITDLASSTIGVGVVSVPGGFGPPNVRRISASFPFNRPPDIRPSFDSLQRAARIERHILDVSRQLSQRLGPPVPLLRAARASAAPAQVPIAGQTTLIKVPRVDLPDFCSAYVAVPARLVYSGSHTLIFEGSDAPLKGTMDADFQALGQEFDNVMYPTLITNFGDPLALDSLLDGNGKIVMLFSYAVNQLGIAGLVSGCDFFPETLAPSSNRGEVFYGVVPWSGGTGYGEFTRDSWRWIIRPVLMHESKHLTAFAEKFSRGAMLEEPWLEEGTAVIAEELWARSVYGNAQFSNATYRQTIYCDVRPTDPSCTGRPYSMFNAYQEFYDYIVNRESRSVFGPMDINDATFFGSSWSMVRWAIDAFGGSEADFLKALTQEPYLTGIANLQARTGRPANTLVSEWTAAWAGDDRWPTNSRELTFPSWNLTDVFRGMNADFPDLFPWDHPLQWPGPHLTTLPGGTATFIAVVGQGVGDPGRILITLQSPDGGVASPFLYTQVLRIQ